jgi:uncharacterized protein (TIGR00369 family)
MGQRGAHTCDVIFDNVRVPAANLIGLKEGQGFKTAMKVLEKGRIHIAAIAVGAAVRMLDDALRYAMQRKQFGQPIAEFQLVQAMLADSKAELYAAQCMVMDAARRRDAGENVATEASCCKMFASEMCGRVADRAVQIFGGAGYLAEYGIERFYRDVRLFRIYEGTTQIQQLVIARNMIRAAVVMTLLDVAMARAAISVPDAPTTTVVTVEMSSRFLKPGRGPLLATGRVINAGRSICTCEAHVHMPDGTHVAAAMGTFKYWRGPVGGVE